MTAPGVPMLAAVVVATALVCAAARIHHARHPHPTLPRVPQSSHVRLASPRPDVGPGTSGETVSGAAPGPNGQPEQAATSRGCIPVSTVLDERRAGRRANTG